MSAWRTNSCPLFSPSPPFPLLPTERSSSLSLFATFTRMALPNAAPPEPPRWLTQLDSRWPQRDTSLRYALSRVLREYLLCEDTDAAATYAKRFDDFYHTVSWSGSTRRAKRSRSTGAGTYLPSTSWCMRRLSTWPTTTRCRIRSSRCLGCFLGILGKRSGFIWWDLFSCSCFSFGPAADSFIPYSSRHIRGGSARSGGRPTLLCHVCYGSGFDSVSLPAWRFPSFEKEVVQGADKVG